VSYRLRFLRRAEKEFVELPKDTRALVQRRLDDLTADPQAAGGRRLTSTLRGLSKLRVGDYRVSYQIDHEAQSITVWQVGHRSKFYEQARRRWR